MICCYEMRKGRGSCVEPSSLKNFGSMFDAEAIHAQIPSNIEPNYQRTWCNGHKTGHASFLSSYIAILPLVSPMWTLLPKSAKQADFMPHLPLGQQSAIDASWSPPFPSVRFPCATPLLAPG